MNKNTSTNDKNMEFKVGDYITYFSDRNLYNGTILDIDTKKKRVKIVICISCKKAEEPIFEEIEDVELSKINKRF
jgi:hypothetical protein